MIHEKRTQKMIGKSIIRWIILLLGICMIAETMTACNIGYRGERKEKAERLLSEKYNEEIKVMNYSGQEVLSDYYTVTAQSSEHPNLPFEASIEVNGEGLSDNYAGRRIAATISERVTRNLYGLQGKVFVYSKLMADMVPPEYAKMTAEEFVAADPDNRTTINVFIKDEDLDATTIYTSLRNMCAGFSQMDGVLNLYAVSEDAMNEIKKYTEENVKLYADFKDSFQKYQILSGRFENGQIDFDLDDLTAALRKTQ